jgi:hypothetical protein
MEALVGIKTQQLLSPRHRHQEPPSSPKTALQTHNLCICVVSCSESMEANHGLLLMERLLVETLITPGATEAEMILLILAGTGRKRHMDDG